MELIINEKNDNNVKIINDKYKPEDLTADGIPTIETQIKEISLDEENKKSKLNDEQLYNREMIQRVKCLSLNKMNKDIFTNTFEMKISDRKKLQEIMHTYNDIEHTEIIKEFNDLISENYLDNPQYDYTKAPIYQI